jgi:hypothetical protein
MMRNALCQQVDFEKKKIKKNTTWDTQEGHAEEPAMTKAVHGSKVPRRQHHYGESSFVVSIIDDDAIAVSDFMPPPNLQFAFTKSL